MIEIRFGSLKFSIGKKDIFADALSEMMADGMTSGDKSVPATKSTAAALQENRGWVYSAVSTIGERIATLDSNLVTVTNSGKEIVVEQHPFLNVWNRPNPFFNGVQFRILTQAYLDLAGEAFWFLVLNRLGLPQQIWPIPPHEIDIKVREDGSYVYVHRPDDRAAVAEYDPDQIVYFRYPHAGKSIRGWSPLKAASLAYDEDKLIQEYHWRMLKKGGWFLYALATEKGLNESQAKQVQKSWMRRFRSVEAQGEPPVLPYGLKPVSLQQDVLSMGSGEREAVLRDRILAAYKTPRGVIGLTEGLPRANLEGAIVAFNTFAIKPRLRLWMDVINVLLRRYARPVELRFENPVPIDRTQVSSELSAALNSGSISINEYRQVMNMQLGYSLEDRPEREADQLLVPLNRFPLASMSQLSAGNGGGQRSVTRTAYSEEQKTAIWKRFDVMLSKNEKIFARFMKSAAEKMRAEVESKLESALKMLAGKYAGWSEAKVRVALAGTETKTPDVNAVIPDRQKWFDYFVEEGGAVISEIFEENGTEALEFIGGEGAFDLENVRSRFYLGRRTQLFSNSVISTHWSELQNTLTEGFAAGESIEQLTARVNSVYTNFETWQAERTARTETIAASNAGRFEGYKQGGIKTKEWLTAQDGDVRDSHIIAGQQYTDGGEPGPIPLDEDFIVGEGAGPSPGNLGAAAEDINCRCTVLPIVESGE